MGIFYKREKLNVPTKNIGTTLGRKAYCENQRNGSTKRGREKGVNTRTHIQNRTSISRRNGDMRTHLFFSVFFCCVDTKKKKKKHASQTQFSGDTCIRPPCRAKLVKNVTL